MLSMGWHSGAVFGPSASAAAVSKLLRLPAHRIEDALGIACTQACGLMSAQYESDVKRMQHGFASRNGLFAALMAQGDYVGIKQVYERPYGGFLAVFGQGSKMDPLYQPEEVAKGLGEPHVWQINSIRPKPYAAMAGTHGTIDCIAALQERYPQEMADLENISEIIIEICAEAIYKHGGWKAERPLTVTGAQMSNEYSAALQLVDKQVLPAQYRQEAMDRDVLWMLIEKMTCVHNKELGGWWAQRVTVNFKDRGQRLVKYMPAPRGVDPELSNEDILAKWRLITEGIINIERQQQIEQAVLSLEDIQSIDKIRALLARYTCNPIV